MEKSELLELRIRRHIFNCIRDTPGMHLRELSRKLHLSYHNLRYHVNYLKKHNLIVVKSDNSYSRLYITSKIGIKEKKLLSFLRQETTKQIILTIFFYIACSEKVISKELNKNQEKEGSSSNLG